MLLQISVVVLTSPTVLVSSVHTKMGVPSRNSGVLTPDLNFAEIGHGRGAQSGSLQYPLRRGHEHFLIIDHQSSTLTYQ